MTADTAPPPHMPGRTGFVMRPSVALAIPYLGACAFWLIGVLLSSTHGAVGTPRNLISMTQLVSLSVVDLAFVIAMVVDGFALRRHLPGTRRGALSGVVLGIACIVVLQLGVILAYNPWIFTAAPGK